MSKILLVEDNEMNRDMLSRRLTRRHYEVILATDGQEGVERCRSEHPDVVLMDISLPVLDGWQAIALLKHDPLTQNIPIIALTAHALAADRQRAFDEGCEDFDTKPVDLPRLIGKIEAVLAKSRQ
ncbi:Response regulator receiver domain-containing protein [Sulfobacillus thermosulfidooxidans DSM 9293]|uniref:Stage 0 sporulation protein A homolog n=1 Tax=Sulfobacillus thermosulfidooxidans (strain DSM 9293 / VKM B-1269 / AT-1) TaxID=929705 RepID=A0A1W1WF90_SULTA|nr:response regulator [Sulfobacillus thermosulfidooxidans]SMC04710.1 Response regulator receiver domain-containing protein [Sulfobacillus thermosulfidooxidans DSM 9293]